MTAAAQRMLLVRTIDLAGFTGDPDWGRTKAAIPADITRWKTRGPVTWKVVPYTGTSEISTPTDALGMTINACMVSVFEDERGIEVASRLASTIEHHGRMVPVEHPLEDDDLHPGDRVVFSLLAVHNPGAVAAVRIYAQAELIS